MKQLKIKTKLLLSFSVIILLIAMLTFSGIVGMNVLDGMLENIMEETLPNKDKIHTIETNLESNMIYLLYLTKGDSPSQKENYINHINSSIASNKDIIMALEKNNSINPELITQLNKANDKLSTITSRFLNNINSISDNNSSLKAELFTVLDDEINLIRKISSIENEKIALEEQGANKLNIILQATLYFFNLCVLIVLVLIMKRLMTLILVPLNKITTAAQNLANGDFSKSIDYQINDEFGAVCKNLQTSFDSFSDMIRTISEEVETLENGNFNFKVDKKFNGETQIIQNSIDKLITNLNDVFVKIKLSIGEIETGSSQLSSSAQMLAQGATEQASTIENLSIKLSDISKRVEYNAEHAKQATSLSSESNELAKLTLEDMQILQSSMNEIYDKSNNIEKIIRVIEDIAFQTNILALNAAVEAARAGTAGKGFSVVADEVRSLAAKSAEAAKNTTTLIGDAINAVNSGVKISDKTNESFKILIGKVSETVNIVDEISVASNEQSKAISDITSGFNEINSVIQTNSAASEESAATSEELASQASMLNTLVNQFNLKENT